MPQPLVGNGVEPMGELGVEVVEVPKRAPVEERSLEFPKTALDTRLCIGLTAHRLGAKLVIRGKGEKARIVNRLSPFPTQHHGFLAVVLAGLGASFKSRERSEER